MQIRWDELSPEQLNQTHLWVYADPTDGEYVKPFNGHLPTGCDVGDFLFATRFTFRDGTRHVGFIHGVRGSFSFTEDCFGKLSPYIIMPNDLALNLFAFPPRNWKRHQDVQVETRARLLGCDVLEIYPVEFETLRGDPGIITTGTIPGLMFYRIVQKQTWFRRAKTELMVVLPEDAKRTTVGDPDSGSTATDDTDQTA